MAVTLQVRLRIGMYSVFLKDWLAVFPANQVRIVRFEDYKKDMKGVLQTLYYFLGLGAYIS